MRGPGDIFPLVPLRMIIKQVCLINLILMNSGTLKMGAE